VPSLTQDQAVPVLPPVKAENDHGAAATPVSAVRATGNAARQKRKRDRAKESIDTGRRAGKVASFASRVRNVYMRLRLLIDRPLRTLWLCWEKLTRARTVG